MNNLKIIIFVLCSLLASCSSPLTGQILNESEKGTSTLQSQADSNIQTTETATSTISPTITETHITLSTPDPSPTVNYPKFDDWEIAFTAHVIDDQNNPYNSFHHEVQTIRLVDQQSARLVEIPVDSYRPKWSPDGKRIAYLSFNEDHDSLFILDLESGQNYEIENVYCFEWSKDGQSIVYVEYGTWPWAEDKEFRYYIARVDDLDNSKVFLVAEWRAIELQWSPSGDRIMAIGSRRIGTDQAWHIYIIDLNGNVQEIPTQKVPGLHASWHPDGEKIAYFDGEPEFFEKPSEIRIIDLQTLEEQDLTHTGRIAQYPEWSPDGSLLAFVSMPVIDPQETFPINQMPHDLIYILNVGTEKTIKLSGYLAGGMSYPTWSPDGKYLAFIQGLEMILTSYLPMSHWLNVFELETEKITVLDAKDVELSPPTWNPKPGSKALPAAVGFAAAEATR